jgi:hypothetical protein
MYLLNLIYRTGLELARQTRLLLQSLASGVRKWHRQRTPYRGEAERLDRIRNPSKYLGK